MHFFLFFERERDRLYELLPFRWIGKLFFSSISGRSDQNETRHMAVGGEFDFRSRFEYNKKK